MRGWRKFSKFSRNRHWFHQKDAEVSWHEMNLSAMVDTRGQVALVLGGNEVDCYELSQFIERVAEPVGL